MSHSEIGPSGAERWVNCPGSVRLSRGLPDRTSKYAAEGSVAHGLGEQVLTGKLDETKLMLKVGDVVEHDGHDIEITEEMVLYVLAYVAACQKDIGSISASYKSAAVHSHAELKVALTSIDPDLKGTLDHVAFRRGDKMIVRDLKTGKGKAVSAKENFQLAIYALGAMETVAGEAYDEVELVIDQPRISGEDRWTAPAAWLREFKEKLRAAVAATKAPDAPLKAGSWCRWCKAQAVCPEIVGAVQREVGADFAAAPLPINVEVNKAKVATLAPAALGRMLEWAEPMESLYAALWAYAQTLLESGIDVPGWKLVAGRAVRKWADGTGETAAHFFAPQHGERVYTPRKPLSVAQMEKLVGAKALPTGFVIKPPSSLKVAHVSDPRPAMTSSAQHDFEQVAAAPVAELPAPVDPLFGSPAPEDPLFAAPQKAKAIWPQ